MFELIEQRDGLRLLRAEQGDVFWFAVTDGRASVELVFLIAEKGGPRDIAELLADEVHLEHAGVHSPVVQVPPDYTDCSLHDDGRCYFTESWPLAVELRERALTARHEEGLDAEEAIFCALIESHVRVLDFVRA
jgi:hypothetical protein